jgi:hypothetical protein
MVSSLRMHKVPSTGYQVCFDLTRCYLSGVTLPAPISIDDNVSYLLFEKLVYRVAGALQAPPIFSTQGVSVQ